jgi:hypothetical protein
MCRPRRNGDAWKKLVCSPLRRHAPKTPISNRLRWVVRLIRTRARLAPSCGGLRQRWAPAAGHRRLPRRLDFLREALLFWVAAFRGWRTAGS